MTELLPDSAPAEHEQGDEAEDGLLSCYDVVLCGTSLTNCILASSLARAGFDVLHCDGADYYGELDAVWTLPYITTAFQEKLKNRPNSGVASVETSFGTGNGAAFPSSSMLSLSPLGATQSLVVHSLQSRTNPGDFLFEVGVPVDTPYGKGEIHSITKDDDATTKIIVRLNKWKLANGTHAHLFITVPSERDEPDLATYVFENNGLLHTTCSVARQLLWEQSRSFALDVTPGLVFCAGPGVQGLLTSGVSEYLEFKALQGLLFGADLSVVPCSKSEVFASKLLKAMDKRRLTSFLQLVMDYATAQAMVKDSEAAEAAAADTKEPDTTVVETLNERHLNQGRSLRRPQNKPVASDDIQALQRAMDSGMTFRDYLKEQKLSDSLIELVRFAMALENSIDSRNETSLAQALDSLGRHLMALGRFGTTAFLTVLYGSGELPQAFCRSAAVFGATYMLRTSAKRIDWTETDDNDRITVHLENHDEKRIRSVTCKHVIASQQALCSAKATHRVWRRISVLSNQLIEGGQQRHVVILPPNTVGNHQHVIHGLILDHGVNVSPHAPANALLHLTTVAPIDVEHDESVLMSAMERIIRATSSESAPEEVFHVSFSYDLVEAVPVPSSAGVHLVPCFPPQLAVDHAFDEARNIFETICSDVPFLSVAQKVTQVIEERLGAAALNTLEDEEEAVLESAMMIAKENQESTAANAEA